MIRTQDFEAIEVTAPSQLRDWLAAHHGQHDSVWLVTFKAHVTDKYVSREDVLDELLCFGWIDGLRRKLDDDRTMQLISPRRHQVWAQSYKNRAAHLIAEQRMQPSGHLAIAEAKNRGLWHAMAEVDALIVPEDLAHAFATSPPSAEKFAAFAPSYRRNVLRWLETAKTPATRLKRIGTITALAAKGAKVPQY